MDHWQSRARARLDTKKKSLTASERNPLNRDEFRQRIATRDARDMIIIDEMGSNLNLTPRYARAPRGERAYGAVPRNTPANTTLIASLTLDGMGPAMVLTGATDTAAFEVYVKQFLLPSVRRGQVVVLDNLSAHKSSRVEAMLNAHGCELWPLPAYSPDYSPIEEAFSKLKNGLRRAGARTAEQLLDAIAEGIETISPADADGYFTHCGYRVHSPSDQE